MFGLTEEETTLKPMQLWWVMMAKGHWGTGTGGVCSALLTDMGTLGVVQGWGNGDVWPADLCGQQELSENGGIRRNAARTVKGMVAGMQMRYRDRASIRSQISAGRCLVGHM
eukprot:EG_transcript_20421